MLTAVLLTAVICIAGTYAVAAGGSHQDESTTLNVGGSTTIQPMMVSFQETFEGYAKVSMNVTSGGSSVGANSTINGTLDVGMCSRDLKSSELDQGLVAHIIAKDGVSVIINSSVTGVGSLTLEQIAAIYSGEITNWKDVGGNDKEIAVIAREDGSGTRECFDTVMSSTVSGWKMKSVVSQFASTGAVTNAVTSTPGAIGYVSLGAAEKITSGAYTVAVDGVMPSVETVNDGTYEIQRNLVLATKGPAQGMAALLIAWILSDEGQKTVEESGFIPLS